MQTESEFTVNETTFQFENTASGEEIISVDGSICSAKRSLFGGKHVFEHEGQQYVVKVKPGFRRVYFKVKRNGENVTPVLSQKEEKIPFWVHFACGWPFLIAAVACTRGGAFGGVAGGAIAGAMAGGLGGLAYGLNIGIYKSALSRPLKTLLILSIGVGISVLEIVILRTMFR
ncbi:MAG: hypothetical protein QGG42_13625 [Phycisphaerae bacterium]|jgi:hypothetical protein|nr:hypothetical protein [Phycisphaerae bacterium]